MMAVLETIEQILYTAVEFSVILLEAFGVIILVYTAVRGFYQWAKRGVVFYRADLARGISTALSFKLGGEVLKTVIVHSWQELGMLAAIMLLRAAITLLLHWEIKNETEGETA